MNTLSRQSNDYKFLKNQFGWSGDIVKVVYVWILSAILMSAMELLSKIPCLAEFKLQIQIPMTKLLVCFALVSTSIWLGKMLEEQIKNSIGEIIIWDYDLHSLISRTYSVLSLLLYLYFFLKSTSIFLSFMF